MRHDNRAECEACGVRERIEGEFEWAFLHYVHSECGFEVDPIEVPLCAACIDNPESLRTVREDIEERCAEWARIEAEREAGEELEREALAQLRVVV